MTGSRMSILLQIKKAAENPGGLFGIYLIS
jgi:hypothetical protein